MTAASLRQTWDTLSAAEDEPVARHTTAPTRRALERLERAIQTTDVRRVGAGAGSVACHQPGGGRRGLWPGSRAQAPVPRADRAEGKLVDTHVNILKRTGQTFSLEEIQLLVGALGDTVTRQ